ncbi:hypothetical protein NKH94_30500 [Mesorhizobium australicum]|uniref:hypothetical protein n=1 Tax=Mesorhizobium australicum TaxID=536018 RepID=UPI00333D1D61
MRPFHASVEYFPGLSNWFPDWQTPADENLTSVGANGDRLSRFGFGALKNLLIAKIAGDAIERTVLAVIVDCSDKRYTQ